MGAFVRVVRLGLLVMSQNYFTRHVYSLAETINNKKRRRDIWVVRKS